MPIRSGREPSTDWIGLVMPWILKPNLFCLSRHARHDAYVGADQKFLFSNSNGEQTRPSASQVNNPHKPLPHCGDQIID